MKDIESIIESELFLMVCSGETYFTELVKGSDIVTRMMTAMYGDERENWKPEDIEFWTEQISDEDNWNDDINIGPCMYSTDVGETDHIALYRISPYGISKQQTLEEAIEAIKKQYGDYLKVLAD